MIAFILAGVVALGTVGVAAMVGFANGMSDAPTVRGPRIWPIFAVGFGVAAALVASHYMHLSW